MKTPIDALTGEFKQKHPMGPVVWKKTRKEPDAYYCENNLIATNIQDHATNSSPITRPCNKFITNYKRDIWPRCRRIIK